MSPRYSKPPGTTYQLRVALKGTRPPIWRRFLVSPSMRLSRLHNVLQAVMGWYDSHLHMFIKGRRRFMLPNPWMDDMSLPGEPRFLDERKYRIDQLLKREKDWIEYQYDFGDSWYHRITLQKRDSVQAIAARHEIHPTQVSRWKRQLIEGLPEVFSGDAGRKLAIRLFAGDGTPGILGTAYTATSISRTTMPAESSTATSMYSRTASAMFARASSSVVP